MKEILRIVIGRVRRESSMASIDGDRTPKADLKTTDGTIIDPDSVNFPISRSDFHRRQAFKIPGVIRPANPLQKNDTSI